MFQTDYPYGGADVSGDRKHKWSHTRNPQALLLYISALLSSSPPISSGIFLAFDEARLMAGEERFLPKSVTPARRSLLHGAAAWLNAN